jgi:predicted DNA-binding protein (UPF0251 family)
MSHCNPLIESRTASQLVKTYKAKGTLSPRAIEAGRLSQYEKLSIREIAKRMGVAYDTAARYLVACRQERFGK